MLIRLALVVAVAAASLAAQDKPESFVIDKSKHYVYIRFDHVADRKPLSPNEDRKGLWLRLVNNCRISIIVANFNPGTGDPGEGLYDEVIPISPPKVEFHLGPPKKLQPIERTKPKPPEGYSAEVFSTTIIAPGDDLLFSVPLNHVSPSWYLRIMFNLDVPGGGYGSEPYSTVPFYWQDIPDKIRASNAHVP